MALSDAPAVVMAVTESSGARGLCSVFSAEFEHVVCVRRREEEVLDAVVWTAGTAAALGAVTDLRLLLSLVREAALANGAGVVTLPMQNARSTVGAACCERRCLWLTRFSARVEAGLAGGRCAVGCVLTAEAKGLAPI